MTRRRVVIAGAAGRDFHNFNLVYRGREDVEVVAFTATQIPNIDGRRYPPTLAGDGYGDGIPIAPEASLEELVRSHEVDDVVFAYSDVTHEHVMHLGSRALAAGASFDQAVRRDLRSADRLRQEPDDASRRGGLPRGRTARCGAAPPDAVRRPHEAGGAALRAVRGPRRARLHDRGARGVRAAPRGG